MYVIGINPTTEGTGTHDPSVVIFNNGKLVFAAEEERFNRIKHAERTFPHKALRAGLEFCNIELNEIDKIAVAWEPQEKAKYDIRLALKRSLLQAAYNVADGFKDYRVSVSNIKSRLSEIGKQVPPVETHNHHRCHAASAFYPSKFDECLIVTLDGRGERDSTVVWKGDNGEFKRIRTYNFPNSLGGFFAAITKYLGYRPNNGEGKVMGLAPYGNRNETIESKLRQIFTTGVDYDVTDLNIHKGEALGNLESLFGRPARTTPREFTDWEKDLAHVAQYLLEETVVDIIQTYCQYQQINKVALAGGVALNCKLNKRIMESNIVEDLFIQPVAHDAGGAIGAGILAGDSVDNNEMTNVYWGPAYETLEIKELLDRYKVSYREPDNLEKEVANRLASGGLVGWMQGRLEMGPRALGNRSILADPRSSDSRDRVNEFVKHREEWRPFAPSMIEEAADEYLQNPTEAPYMIRTFDVKKNKREEIPAVLHPADDTTRPQTVNEDQNERYYNLLREFGSITGVPVLLNTSFNDSGEPIVNTPTDAIKDFYGMGLDMLVLEDIVIEK